MDKGLTENINFIGTTNRIYEFLRENDVFILSSDYEGLPISLLEAIASQMPIISTNVGGVPDIIINGKNGVLVPPKNCEQLAEAIVEVSENINLRQSMIYYNKQVYKKYDIREVTNKYINIYINVSLKEGK